MQTLRRSLSFTIAHHLLIFLLAGVLAFEIGVIRPNMKREDVLRVASVDNWYGILAVAILVVGFSRAIYAAKGWAYYEANGFFWAKIAAFVAVAAVDHSDDTDHSLAPGTDGGLGIPPSRTGHRWRQTFLRALTTASVACKNSEPADVHFGSVPSPVKRSIRLESAARSIAVIKDT